MLTNDMFRAGDTVQHGDGEGIANLSYRVSAMYSGRDSVLGTSAGLKHFGKRRLGRSGLDHNCPVPDNVWDIDCSKLIDQRVNGMEVHSAYFQEPKCYDLMRSLLKGIDRSVLIDAGATPPALPKTVFCEWAQRANGAPCMESNRRPAAYKAAALSD